MSVRTPTSPAPRRDLVATAQGGPPATVHAPTQYDGREVAAGLPRGAARPRPRRRTRHVVRRVGIAGGLLGSSLALGAGLTGALGQSTTHVEVKIHLPAPAVSALAIPTPRALGARGQTAVWAPVRRRTVARRGPSASSGAVAHLRLRTPEDTANLVLVTTRAQDQAGHLWVRVRLPGVTATAIGWVPRSALGGLTPVHTRLVVDRRRMRATLLRDGRVVWRAPVAVGRPSAPTPAGTFFVRSRLTRYSSPSYGPVAYGTSARSKELTDWPDGAVVGIHGTDRPDLVPGRVSHGCIRVRNADLRRLEHLMPVGTPVVVRA